MSAVQIIGGVIIGLVYLVTWRVAVYSIAKDLRANKHTNAIDLIIAISPPFIGLSLLIFG